MSADTIPSHLIPLLEGPHFGSLGTIRPDDTVQVNPMWFEFDGQVIRFTHSTTNQKFRNVNHNPSMSLSVMDPENPYQYVEVRGHLIDVVPDTDGQFFVHLARRYGR